jgi:hypothetical protein
MKRNTSQKLVMGALFLTSVLGVELMFVREWKGYFLFLTYVGGLLIIVFYLSRFSTFTRSSVLFLSFVLFCFSMEDCVLYVLKGYGSTIWGQPSLVLFVSLRLICFICFLVRQILLAGASLRLF